MTRDRGSSVRPGDVVVYACNEHGQPMSTDLVTGVNRHDGVVELDFQRHPHATVRADVALDVKHTGGAA